MQKVGGVVQSKGGRVVVGAIVRVFLAGTVTPATIYSDPLGQNAIELDKLKSDNEGEYGFYVANGRYDVKTYVQGRLDGQYLDVLAFDPGDLILGDNSLVPTPSYDDVPRLSEYPQLNAQAQAIANRFAYLDSDEGASRVGFTQSGDGAVPRTTQDKLREVGYSPEDFGAVGNGMADDSLAVQKALQTGLAYLPSEKVYSLNGSTITIGNSLVLSIGAGARLKNGHLSIRPADATRRVEIIGELLGEGMSFTIAGYLANDGSPVDDAGSQAIRCKVGDITTSGKLPSTTCAIQIANVVDSQFGTLTATGSGMGAAVEGVKLNVIFRSEIGNININGDFSMGCEVSGTSTRPVYAAYRSRFGQVTVRKPTSYTDEPGDHGFYLHGAVECEVAGVNGRGWGSVTGANGSFKFRDNLRCTVNGVDVDAMVFSSNNDGPYQSINELNLLRDVVAGRAYFARTAPGDIKGNVFVNFECANFGGTASAAIGTIAAYFEGRVRLGNTAAGNYINVGDAVFRNAEVEFIAPYFLRGSRTRAIKSVFKNGLEEQPQSANDVELTDCTIIGDYYYNPTSGTHSHTMRRVTVTGLLRINSFDSRVVNADWEFVTSGVNEPAAALQPDNKKYRFVSYLDKYYITQNISATT